MASFCPPYCRWCDRIATNSNTAAHPDPEVAAQAKRRPFAGEYKQRIPAAADQAKSSRRSGALLRREGFYSSLLAIWRRERDAGVLQALAPQMRGPQSKRDPFFEEHQQLTELFTEELRKARNRNRHLKKVATLLSRPIMSLAPEEKR